MYIYIYIYIYCRDRPAPIASKLYKAIAVCDDALLDPISIPISIPMSKDKYRERREDVEGLAPRQIKCRTVVPCKPKP